MPDLFGNEKLVALSLWQPWASLMCCADPARADRKPPKEWETRPWYPRVLPPVIAIHATKSISVDERHNISNGTMFREPYASILKRCGFSPCDPWAPGYSDRVVRVNYARTPHDAPLILRELPLGAIVGIGRCSEVRTTDKASEMIGREQRAHSMTEIALGNYQPGRFAWRFVEVRELSEPVRCRGFQQLWPVPDDVRTAVYTQLEAIANA